MDETLLRNITARVGRSDTLYHVGDFAFRSGSPARYREQLKCRRLILIMGITTRMTGAGYPKSNFR